MKRIISIIITVMLLSVFGASAVFAEGSGGFELASCNPEDGYDKVKSNNVMVKMFFTEDVSAEDTQKANENMFEFKDKDGEDIPFKIYYNDKDAKNICLLATQDLKEETDYTVLIKGELQSDSGDILGAPKTIEFKTKKPDSMVAYMLLMTAMIVVMVVMTFRDQKKAMSADGAKDTAPVQTNPYKLAKEKNISVQEAVKLIEAEKEKAVKKAEKQNAKQAVNISKESKAKDTKKKKTEKKVYKVKTKRIVKKH